MQLALEPPSMCERKVSRALLTLQAESLRIDLLHWSDQLHPQTQLPVSVALSLPDLAALGHGDAAGCRDLGYAVRLLREG